MKGDELLMKENNETKPIGVIQEIGDLGGYAELSEKDKRIFEESTKENNNDSKKES